MQTLLQTTSAYQFVQTEASKGTLSHAYLLLFQDARNLRFALKEFAKILFSTDTGSARISNLIDNESFSDCLFYPAEGKKLSVEDAENIREECTLSAVESEKKVIVIGDFAQANTQTQNKLLKVLEEPPAGVIFLLGATSVYPILPTVLSRTKKLEILSFSNQDIKDCLARLYGDKYDESTLSVCSATSDGCLGQAQNILEGGYYRVLTEQAFNLCLSPLSKLPYLAKSVGETKYKKELLTLLRIIFRDALLIKTQGEKIRKNLLLISEKEEIEKVAKAYTPSALIYAQSAISQAEAEVNFNAVFPQCIEVCIAKINRENEKTK